MQLDLDEKRAIQRELNRFRLDPEFAQHEAEWAAVRRELLGESEDEGDDDSDNSGSNDGSGDDASGGDASDGEDGGGALAPSGPTQVHAATSRAL